MTDRDNGNERLAQHVRVDVSDDRIDRLWGGVSARVGVPRARLTWVWPSVVAAAAATAAITIAVVRARSIQAPAPIVARPAVIRIVRSLERSTTTPFATVE